MRIYLFESIDDTLDLVPIAARRALDAAALKVSLDTWRSSPLGVRQLLVDLGAAADVDGDAVRSVLASANLLSSPIARLDEPARDAVPLDLRESVTELAWRSLTPLDRYALSKVARGKDPAELLPRACAEIVPLSTHVGPRGEAQMVDVAGKQTTPRRAVARAHVAMEAATLARLRAGDVAKGDVLGTARIAGIQAAKRTSELIPLCHAIALTRVAIDLSIDRSGAGTSRAPEGVTIEVTAEATDRTGVEMEALTAASVAALTVYDMLKSVDRGMRITVELIEKSGGKTGSWVRP